MNSQDQLTDDEIKFLLDYHKKQAAMHQSMAAMFNKKLKRRQKTRSNP